MFPGLKVGLYLRPTPSSPEVYLGIELQENAGMTHHHVRFVPLSPHQPWRFFYLDKEPLKPGKPFCECPPQKALFRSKQSNKILSENRCSQQHWQSDVIGGCLVGAGTVARLHADPAFRADVEAAKAELAAVRTKGLKPTRDCKAEAAALALQPLAAP